MQSGYSFFYSKTIQKCVDNIQIWCIISNRKRGKHMKKEEFLEKIKHQFEIELEIERSAKNWIYVRIEKQDQCKILPYLEKNKIRYEKHLNNGFFIII